MKSRKARLVAGITAAVCMMAVASPAMAAEAEVGVTGPAGTGAHASVSADPTPIVSEVTGLLGGAL